VRYGFHGPGTPAPGGASDTAPAPAPAAHPVSACAGGLAAGGAVRLGRVVRLRAPRRLAPLPAAVIAAGFGAISCDARIVPDVIALARRYRVRVTACYAIHSLSGEHPLGAATDLVPADGDWRHPDRLARDLGWHASCALSGVAPACARAPFRFIGWNGYPGHGDPAHCLCSTPHLHLSWLTSASAGEPENAARTSYFAPSWIDVFDTTTPTNGGQDG
jgi:hypothetical protein